MWLKSDFSLDALKKVWIKIIPKVICQACRTCHGCHVQWRMWHLWYEYRVYNNVHISSTAVSMTTIRSRVVTYRKELLPIKSHDSFMTRSNEIRDKLNMYHYISTTTVSTKLGRMVNCLEELLAKKSHDTLIAWFYEIT